MKSRTTTVLVLMGGPDAEREVSLMSGHEVAQALRECDVGGESRFFAVEKVIDRPTAVELHEMASACGADVVFPVLHGQWGEGGPLQELLEIVGLPYVGAKRRAAALAMDKLKSKRILADEGVPTPPAQELRSINDRCTIDPPLVLKPVDDGSSVGLRICGTAKEIEHARSELHPRRARLMAESYIQGREITAGIICDRTLPLIEIIPSSSVQFYDYEAKYTRDDTQYVIDPQLPSEAAKQCVDIAQTAYTRLGCRDIARVDIMVDGLGQPWFLEINTMPGFTTHSLVPMAARKLGWNMPALCTMLVEAALRRGRKRLELINSPERVKPQAAQSR